MSLAWRSIRTLLPSGHNWFGTRKVGLPASDILAATNSIGKSRAARYPNSLHRFYVVSKSDSDALFEETGECDTEGVTGIAQHYLDGVLNETYPFSTTPGTTQGGAATWWSAANGW
ncbi:MAG: hypothetical protein AB7Q00_15035 [Phycisphaerales bacterium]